MPGKARVLVLNAAQHFARLELNRKAVSSQMRISSIIFRNLKRCAIAYQKQCTEKRHMSSTEKFWRK